MAAHLDRAEGPGRRLDVAPRFVRDLLAVTASPREFWIRRSHVRGTCPVSTCCRRGSTRETLNPHETLNPYPTSCMASASICSISTVSTSTSSAKARTAAASRKLPTTCDSR